MKKFLAIAVLTITAVITTACGTNNQNTLGYGQNGNCQPGYTYNPSLGCTYTGTYNNGVYTNNTTASCTSGNSYPASTYGCTQGYVMQANQCVCQATLNTTTSGTGGQCQTGYFYLNYPSYGMVGCFQQGPCQAGFVFHTPSGMCVRY